MAVITIDGDANSGKDTIGKIIAKESSFLHLPVNNLYHNVIANLAPEWLDEDKAQNVLANWSPKQIQNYLRNLIFATDQINLKVVDYENVICEVIDLDENIWHIDLSENEIEHSAGQALAQIAAQGKDLQEFINEAIIEFSQNNDLIVTGQSVGYLFTNPPVHANDIYKIKLGPVKDKEQKYDLVVEDKQPLMQIVHQIMSDFQHIVIQPKTKKTNSGLQR